MKRLGTYYLLEHSNPNAPQRSNGKRGWYYPSRTKKITGGVLHCVDALAVDTVGMDSVAENVAKYLATVARPASAHGMADSDSTIELLPTSYTAFHAKGGNSRAIGFEVGYGASLWGRNPEHEAKVLQRTAEWWAPHVVEHGLPLVHLKKWQWEQGDHGFVGHRQLDPARRTDPGVEFPWDDFFMRVAQIINGEEDDVWFQRGGDFVSEDNFDPVWIEYYKTRLHMAGYGTFSNVVLNVPRNEDGSANREWDDEFVAALHQAAPSRAAAGWTGLVIGPGEAAELDAALAARPVAV